MLALANRLQSRQDFRAVFKEGTRRNSSHLTLRALRPTKPDASTPNGGSAEVQTTLNKQLPPVRLGISISTKVSKRAVVRNRIKRQIKAAFRFLLPKLSPGWRLVVVVQPSAAQQKCDYQQFLQELEQLLAAAEVLNGHS